MDDTRGVILARRARFPALAVSVCVTGCERSGTCLSIPPDCDGGPDAPSQGLHILQPHEVCSGERAALKTMFYGCANWVSVVGEVAYDSADPEILRIEGTDAIGVAPGRVMVHVHFTDGSGTGSGEVTVVACEDAATDAAEDASDAD